MEIFIAVFWGAATAVMFLIALGICTALVAWVVNEALGNNEIKTVGDEERQLILDHRKSKGSERSHQLRRI